MACVLREADGYRDRDCSSLASPELWHPYTQAQPFEGLKKLSIRLNSIEQK